STRTRLSGAPARSAAPQEAVGGSSRVSEISRDCTRGANADRDSTLKEGCPSAWRVEDGHGAVGGPYKAVTHATRIIKGSRHHACRVNTKSQDSFRRSRIVCREAAVGCRHEAAVFRIGVKVDSRNRPRRRGSLGEGYQVSR